VLAACGSAAHAGETSAPVTAGASGPSHFSSAASGSGRLVDVSAGGGYEVYLPPGYSAAARKGTRFPVLYLLHGDGNGPRHSVEHMFNNGRVAATFDQLLHSGSIRPFLIVMPKGYDGTSVDDTEWANTPHGGYESMVLQVVRSVDGHFATLATRSARAIGGLSMGGYGAVNIALHHPALFGAIESWSGYFRQTPTAVFAGASPALLRRNSPADYLPSVAGRLKMLRPHVLLYGGATDPLTRQQAPFAAQLRSLGVPTTTAVFSGPHDYRLWSRRMPLALEFAGRWLGRSGGSGQ
jgi:enterochelin esterase-like enzyme